MLTANVVIQRLTHALLSHRWVDLPAREMMALPQVKQVLGHEKVLGLHGRLQKGSTKPGRDDGGLRAADPGLSDGGTIGSYH
jgi:hypothetical protein